MNDSRFWEKGIVYRKKRFIEWILFSPLKAIRSLFSSEEVILVTSSEDERVCCVNEFPGLRGGHEEASNVMKDIPLMIAVRDIPSHHKTE
ncbi:hypothetical protein AVEN_141986-1 [Araneus ventricosus]|uniref:Uncharacterized protein n=1 Tax=Araneus ventricosus TaxID=182803 RepID=A0A4Y2KHX3_ARAVE|nr:hypothetical protein AVEN_141986-1 [Araneus ventricosus]